MLLLKDVLLLVRKILDEASRVYQSVHLIAHGVHFETVVKYLTSCGFSSNVLALSMTQRCKLFLLYRSPESLTYRNNNKNMTRHCIKQEHIDKSVYSSHLIYYIKLCNAPATRQLKVVLLTTLYCRFLMRRHT